MVPMPAAGFDDKASDTLVVGPRLKVLDGEFDSPPSPPSRSRCHNSASYCQIAGLISAP
jgi:hypothetical protein